MASSFPFWTVQHERVRPPQGCHPLPEIKEARSHCSREEEGKMTGTAIAVQDDMSTHAGQVSHYHATRRRLWGSEPPRPKVVLPVTEEEAPERPMPTPVLCQTPILDMLAPPSWRFLVSYVALKHGVQVEEIATRRRARKIDMARHEALYVVYWHTLFSTTQVGKLFGGRDHSSVLHSLHRFPPLQKPARAAPPIEKQVVAATPDARAQSTPLRRGIARAYQVGAPVSEIAEAYNSTPGSVRALACIMGLHHPNYRRLRQKRMAAQ